MRVPLRVRVLILHNQRAGDGRLSRAKLVRAFDRAGHEVRYRTTHQAHWKRQISKADVVVAAGGDGTVAKVVIALAKHGRKAPPLAVIPAGKANNIARALGASSSLARTAAMLSGRPSVRLAVGLIRSPWGTARFVESAGIGPLASLFRVELSTLRAARRFLRDAFRTERPRRLHIRADERDLRGDYVMVHVMNIDAAGPRLVYAAAADPGDRSLDLVVLRDSERDAFNRYLDRLAAGKPARCPIEPLRVRRVEIASWPTRDGGHVDDKIWPGKKRPKRGRVRLEVETTIPVFVP